MQTTPEQNADNVNGYLVLSLLAARKVSLIVVGLVAAASAIAIVLIMPNYYTASLSAVPPRKSVSALDAAVSSVSSTLREFGLSKLGGKRGDSYDLIVLLQSRQVKDSVIKKFDLARVYDLPDTAMFAIREEFEENIAINVEVEGNYTVTVDDTNPQRAADIANYMVAVTNQLSQRLDKRETEILYRQFENRMKQTDSSIQVAQDSLAHYTKENLVFSPLDQVKVAAQALGELKAGIMKQEIVISYMEESYGKDDPLTVREKGILEELKKKLNNSMQQPGLVGNIALADAPKAAVPYMEYYGQLEALLKVKAFLVPSFDQVKLDLTKETPSLYVLDDAVPPQKKSRPKRSLIVGSAVLAAEALWIIFILIGYQLRIVSQKLRTIQTAEDKSTL
ncbi:MAG: hypothetical protein ACK5JL_09765 [Candidatus Kapaibacterium sp.]|jgi:tyrosine-protein kinase Etk/Wzc